jgi:hypothetical protein
MDAGMLVSGEKVVFMGGLAMQYMPITKEQANTLITEVPGVRVAGVYFL